MKQKFTLMFFFLFNVYSLFATDRVTINISGSSVTADSYSDQEVIINGATELHLTSSSAPLTNSIVELNSNDSWLFFDNLRPAAVVSNYLKYIYVNGNNATYNSNCRVSIYKHGTVVIPQAPSFQPLTVYSGLDFTEDSTSDFSLFTKNTSLGTFDNKIRSLKLKRGYMVTLATLSSGLGYSRVYIADDKDLELSELPDLLDNKISFIRVLRWEWPSKKGWAGSDETEYTAVNATWRYDWSASGSTSSKVEYVPIKQKSSWPSWDDINGKEYVTHVLGYNEPDATDQGNFQTLDAMLSAWPSFMQTGLRIGSPAWANAYSTAESGSLFDFIDACDSLNYRVDFVALHCYWGGKTPANWYKDLKYIHDRTGRPLWITEWNNGANWTTESWPTDSLACLQQQLTAIKGILQVLDTASFVERYSIYNWVEDKRAMVISGNLTPAGSYYSADTSEIAFNHDGEVIPNYIYGDPSLSIAYGTKSYSLTVSDPNSENYAGCIIDRKANDDDYLEYINSDKSTVKIFTEALDTSGITKVRYKVRSKFSDGSISDYSNDVGYELTNGLSDAQYGNMSIGNIDWNVLFFKNSYQATPAIVLGAPTNLNSSIYLVPRVKLVSAASRTTVELSPWSYQNVTSLSNEETVPYFILSQGQHDLGGITAFAGLSTAGKSWTSVSFSTPFDTIPVVFANQIATSTSYATTLRIRNVSKSGFEVKLQKESGVTATLPTEMISYIALTPGTGEIDGKKVIVNKTADKAVSSMYSSIFYGESVSNPMFLSQMQTCYDDTITSSLRCLAVAEKYANVIKQREKSTGQTTQKAEMVGWMVMSLDASQTTDVNNIALPEFKIYPNPVKTVLHLNSECISENMKVSIYNSLGMLVQNFVLDGNSINVSSLPPGCYFLRVEGYKTCKFIKY